MLDLGLKLQGPVFYAKKLSHHVALLLQIQRKHRDVCGFDFQCLTNVSFWVIHLNLCFYWNKNIIISFVK